jgi:hypothetical protein
VGVRNFPRAKVPIILNLPFYFIEDSKLEVLSMIVSSTRGWVDVGVQANVQVENLLKSPLNCTESISAHEYKYNLGWGSTLVLSFKTIY